MKNKKCSKSLSARVRNRNCETSEPLQTDNSKKFESAQTGTTAGTGTPAEKRASKRPKPGRQVKKRVISASQEPTSSLQEADKDSKASPKSPSSQAQAKQVALGAQSPPPPIFKTINDIIERHLPAESGNYTASAGTTGSRVGIEHGFVDIILDRLEYRPGDTIDGRIILQLNQPVLGDNFFVGLHAIQTIRTENFGPNNELTTEIRTVPIYNCQFNLGEAQEYTSGEYSVSFQIPSDLVPIESPPAKTSLGKLARLASRLTADTEPPIRWEIVARLDIPWKIPISKKREIMVVEPEKSE